MGKVVYRRYASLFFIVGAIRTKRTSLASSNSSMRLWRPWTSISDVCELDIMFNLEKAHFVLDEMVLNGCIVETNKQSILKPIALMEKAS